MQSENYRTVALTEDLRSSDAFCTLEEAIARPDITGCFGDYLYCVKNGRQVLLGHGGNLEPMSPGSVVTTVQSVFVTKGPYQHRNPETWEALRDYLNQGWIIGTVKQPGIKLWFADNGRNNRRTPERLFVFKNT